jgi:hypothetical protein
MSLVHLKFLDEPLAVFRNLKRRKNTWHHAFPLMYKSTDFGVWIINEIRFCWSQRLLWNLEPGLALLNQRESVWNRFYSVLTYTIYLYIKFGCNPSRGWCTVPQIPLSCTSWMKMSDKAWHRLAEFRWIWTVWHKQCHIVQQAHIWSNWCIPQSLLHSTSVTGLGYPDFFFAVVYMIFGNMTNFYSVSDISQLRINHLHFRRTPHRCITVIIRL